MGLWAGPATPFDGRRTWLTNPQRSAPYPRIQPGCRHRPRWLSLNTAGANRVASAQQCARQGPCGRPPLLEWDRSCAEKRRTPGCDQKTHYNRFVRWAKRGIWERIFSVLAAARTCPTVCTSTPAASRSTAAPGAEKEALAHGIGRTNGRRNTKLHAVCDIKGRPLVLMLTPGNVTNCKVARALIEALPPAAVVVADGSL